MPKAKPRSAVKQQEEKTVFIVNPGGAVHEVFRVHARERLRSPGWRIATAEEIAEYHARVIQRADDPIAPPWNIEDALEAATEE